MAKQKFDIKIFLYQLAGVFLIIAIFAIAFFYNFSTNVSNINNWQKQAIVKYAYNVLNKEINKSQISFLGNNLPLLKQYDKIFITFFENGATLCSQGGETDKTDPARLSKDIAEAVKKCLNENVIKTKKEIAKENIDSINIVVDILYGEKKIESRTNSDLQKEIQLGINAVKLENKGNSSYIKASYPIEKRYSLQTSLQLMCKKAGGEKDCYKKQEVILYKYNSVSFTADKKGKVDNFYRNSKLVELSDINQQYILNSIDLAYQWFKNNVDPNTGIPSYIYYPERDVYARTTSHGRIMAAAWAAGEIGRFLGREDLKETAWKTLDYYLNFLTEKDGARYIKIKNDSRMAYNAFLMLALLEQKDYPDRDRLMSDLADSVLQQQREDGSFNTDFEKEISRDDEGNNYYPGEAMLALMRLYNETGKEKYKQSVEKAFLYYRDYWRENKNTALIPWHTQTYKLLFDITGNRELTDFVFEMNDWVVDNYQKTSVAYADYEGGFGEKPSNASASYLEGLADAYYLAKKIGDKEHIVKYAEACRQDARFVLQTQFKEGDVFYIKNPQKALGGFKQSPLNISLRCDYTQHSTLALIKVYQNNLFK